MTILISSVCFPQKLSNAEMLGHIGNVRQALRYAVGDFHGDELPGFCLPGKVHDDTIAFALNPRGDQ